LEGAKKEKPRRDPGFRVFVDVLWGVFRKVRVWTWCFCGEVVVNCVVKRGWLTAALWGRKMRHLFDIYFWVVPFKGEGVERGEGSELIEGCGPGVMGRGTRGV
jgi:hypothetical protein